MDDLLENDMRAGVKPIVEPSFLDLKRDNNLSEQKGHHSQPLDIEKEKQELI